MKVGIVGNAAKLGKDGEIEQTVRFLRSEGFSAEGFSSNSEIDGVDVVIALGGDGTILHAAKVAACKGIKIIGINYGHVGFLAEYEKEEREKITELLLQLQEKKCKVLRRSLLEVSFAGEKAYALNEISLQRDYINGIEQTIGLKVSVNDIEIDTKTGDGILLCTPTGSTAYSFSAGGAFLTPDAPVFMLTPICPFSLNSRPIVFPDTDKFTVKAKKGKALLFVDGKAVESMSEEMEISVCKAPFTADFPMRGNSCFFKKIRTKLNQ